MDILGTDRKTREAHGTAVAENWKNKGELCCAGERSASWWWLWNSRAGMSSGQLNI